MKGLSEFLRAEFMARVDEIVVFNPLDQQALSKIARLMLEEMREPLSNMGLELSYDEKALALLAEKSGGGKFAARDLRSTIRRLVQDKIALLVLDLLPNQKKIVISGENDEISVALV